MIGITPDPKLNVTFGASFKIVVKLQTTFTLTLLIVVNLPLLMKTLIM